MEQLFSDSEFLAPVNANLDTYTATCHLYHVHSNTHILYEHKQSYTRSDTCHCDRHTPTHTQRSIMPLILWQQTHWKDGWRLII